jgi:3-oxoacyl-[acyl-carrier-protein] synthase-3
MQQRSDGVIGVKISGIGKCVPKQKTSNEELTKWVDTSDEWITSRTGIRNRYIATDETTTDLAIGSAKEALKDAGKKGEEIDLIIVATITPEDIMPSTACKVQAAIGASRATAFDITAACSGFIFASKLATTLIQSGEHKNALIIGAETLSKTLDWEDRATCVLFGDGAGAVIYTASAENKILAIETQSNGEKGECLTLKGSPLHNPYVESKTCEHFMAMDGKEVYRFATTTVPQSIKQIVEEKAKLSLKQIQLFILHQANGRIMDSVAKKLEVDPTRFFKNLQEYGNTSAASIPLALSEAKQSLKEGDLLVLCGFGGGLTWGSMVVCW